MPDDNRPPAIRTPTTDEIFGRLLLAIFPIATFACLGLGLQATDLFGWYVTVIVITTTTLIHALLRGPRLDGPTPRESKLAERFGPLREAVDAVPLLQKANTQMGYQFVIALTFGIIVATLEQIVAGWMFTWAGETSGTLLSLFLVLSVAYFIAESIRGSHKYESSEWMGKLTDALRHATDMEARELRASTKALISALTRASLSVIARVIAMLILPMVFSNGWMVAALVLCALGIIAGFDTIPALFKAALSAAKPTPDPPSGR